MDNQILHDWNTDLERQAITLAFKRLPSYRFQDVYWVRNDHLGIVLIVEFVDENEYLRFFVARSLNAIISKLHRLASID